MKFEVCNDCQLEHDLDQVIGTVQRDDRDLTAACMGVEAARARLAQSGDLAKSCVDVAAGRDLAFRNEGAYSTSIGISPERPIAGRLARQTEVARVDVELSRREILNALRRFAGEIAAKIDRIVVLDRRIQAREDLSVSLQSEQDRQAIIGAPGQTNDRALGGRTRPRHARSLGARADDRARASAGLDRKGDARDAASTKQNFEKLSSELASRHGAAGQHGAVRLKRRSRCAN